MLEWPGSIAGRAAGSREWQFSFETAEGQADASSPPGRWALVAPVYDFPHDLAPGYSVGSQFVRVETIIEVTRPDGGVLRIARDPGTGPSNKLSGSHLKNGPGCASSGW